MMLNAGSIYTGDKLLKTGTAGDDMDGALFAKLGIVPMRGDMARVEAIAAE